MPYSRSPVWEFNDTFWRHMRAYVGTHGRDYRDSISGSPDSDVELVRANARRFLEQVVEARGDPMTPSWPTWRSASPASTTPGSSSIP